MAKQVECPECGGYGYVPIEEDGRDVEMACYHCSTTGKVDAYERDYVEDDDPQCVCGTYRSEHAMMGCPEGFRTPEQWEAEREFIIGLDDFEFERIYGRD